MPIHEKSLIREENLVHHDQLEIDGIDVSGHWSTFITDRVITDYNEEMQEEIAALPGGEKIHRCWQCGSCTNACTVNAINERFNPRYWIYLIRLGLEEELLRDKDIIWQCVSCNKCTYICPRDVTPEGVMKATAAWLEMKGHTPVSPAHEFDDVFYQQIRETGKIEESRTMEGFFERTNQEFTGFGPFRMPAAPWFQEMVARLVRHLPVKVLFHMGMAKFFRPKTKGWDAAGKAMQEYLDKQNAKRKQALGLDS